MLRRDLDLLLAHDQHFLRCAQLDRLRAAQDRDALAAFRPVGRALPTLGRCEDDALVEVFGGGGRGGEACHNAAAVGEERGREGDGGVEGLADEKIAVVEGRRKDGYLEVLWWWLRRVDI